MDLLSFVISVISFGLAVFATITAKSAKQAATSAVLRKDNQEDRETLKDLIAKLDKAKETAMREQIGAPEIQGASRTENVDTFPLTDAEDALRTGLPLCFGDNLKVATDAAANEIQSAVGAIQGATTSNRDGWKDALATIQTLIPRLRQEERQMKNQEVLAD